MANYTKVAPSGGTDFVPIEIAATATAGTIFHTADSTAIDEIWMWLSNSTAADKRVTIEFGGVVAPDNHIIVTVPANDSVLAVPGVPLKNSKICRAFAPVANEISMWGHVNRIS